MPRDERWGRKQWHHHRPARLLPVAGATRPEGDAPHAAQGHLQPSRRGRLHPSHGADAAQRALPVGHGQEPEQPRRGCTRGRVVVAQGDERVADPRCVVAIRIDSS